MQLSESSANLLGAITAISLLSLTLLVFVFRLAKLAEWEYVTGLIFVAGIIPLVYLLVTSSSFERSNLYYIQLVLMILFILLEFALDYLFKIDFRHTQWMLITYVTLFFASTGGLIGIATLAGRPFTISAIVLFLSMVALAFYQRAKTGM